MKPGEVRLRFFENWLKSGVIPGRGENLRKAVSCGVAALGGAGHDRVIVQNNPINFVDPDGLEIKFPLIYNFIDSPKGPLSDADIALAFSPIGSVGKVENLVYQGVKDGIIRYIGRTGREATKRFCEHKEVEKGIFEAVEQGLTKLESRILEQNLINLYGLEKNGGQLVNKINSIAQKYWSKYGINP